jgi:hypothetical protein
LRNGAYNTLSQDEQEIEHFTNMDIDEILSRNTKKIDLGGNAARAATFSRATFDVVEAGGDADDDADTTIPARRAAAEPSTGVKKRGRKRKNAGADAAAPEGGEPDAAAYWAQLLPGTWVCGGGHVRT